METSSSLLDGLRRSTEGEGWQRLDDPYRPLILTWLRRDPTLRDHADDLAQAVLLVVWQKLPSFERERTGSFRKWLRKITAFRVQGQYRTRQFRTDVRAFRRFVLDGVKPAKLVADELGVSVHVVLNAKSRILARRREVGRGLLE